MLEAMKPLRSRIITISCSFLLGICLKEPLSAGWCILISSSTPIVKKNAPCKTNLTHKPRTYTKKALIQLCTQADALFCENVNPRIPLAFRYEIAKQLHAKYFL